MNDQANYELSQFGDALAEMENASGLLSLISPAISAAETEGMYGQSKIRGGQGVLDFQMKNIGDDTVKVIMVEHKNLKPIEE